MDYSAECDNRYLTREASLHLDCRMWLASIPERRSRLNRACPRCSSRTSRSTRPTRTTTIQGGTQDNGSPDTTAQVEPERAGDGAPPAIDSAAHDPLPPVLRRGDRRQLHGQRPGSWIWIGDPLAYSPEGAAIFYGPLIADPSISKTAFAGLQHVWRTKKAGGEQAFLEAHCNTNTGDLAFSGPNSGCGDWSRSAAATRRRRGQSPAGPDPDKGGGAAGVRLRARALRRVTVDDVGGDPARPRCSSRRTPTPSLQPT